MQLLTEVVPGQEFEGDIALRSQVEQLNSVNGLLRWDLWTDRRGREPCISQRKKKKRSCLSKRYLRL